MIEGDWRSRSQAFIEKQAIKQARENANKYCYCVICRARLWNGLDTYGEVGQELCQACYLSLLEEQPEPYVDIRTLMQDEEE